MDCVDLLLGSRKNLPKHKNLQKLEAEGGCGVIGLASTVQIEGKHIFASCKNMRNRGNGKGGGIAAAGLSHDLLKVSKEILENDYLLQIAYLDPSCQEEVEASFITPVFDCDSKYRLETLDDYKSIPGLEQEPPPVYRYFLRVKPQAIDRFVEENGLQAVERAKAEDELVWQNSYRLNHAFYASLGEKRAFVLCHSKDLLVLKVVGYAEDVLQYYKLEEFPAHVWIGHQRYPTKGRVWHPGGAHPFIGLHEALVHNGDFANYARVTKSLLQRGIAPQFLTDTEVSVLLFDLWTRIYRYSLELTFEALAPTTEYDFYKLPPEKQRIYQAIQSAHIKASPDGPWFFIVARSVPGEKLAQLIGITDTSMLRPQVFALQDVFMNGKKNAIGIIASEKQAIDAALKSLENAGHPFSYPADKYWNARGGSHSDGGAFVFEINKKTAELRCTDKFGREVSVPEKDYAISEAFKKEKKFEADVLPKASLQIGLNSRDCMKPPASPEDLLAVDATGFAPEGPESLSRFLVIAYRMGWRRIAVYRALGQRFIGCGFGPGASGRLDVYGTPGDYLASGLDGLEVFVHSNAQDQAGQILKDGKLVIYGDAGQTFMYAAKGGAVYVLGNTAGRPLINAVGKPRVVINGTCLDYLAESFMAGDPLKGGGFVILNGVKLTGKEEIQELDTPYPGANLFSLASGGAIYIRDPRRVVEPEQLNGGKFESLSGEDWKLILPYLEENERLFGIPANKLLSAAGKVLSPEAVYRKVVPTRLRALIAHD